MSTTAVRAYEPVTYANESPIRSKFEDLLREVPAHHFFPVATMRKMLEKYSNEELDLVYQDLIEIRHLTFQHAAHERTYVVTAGGPASGKSTLMEAIATLQRAYIDPDRTCLLQMERTYQRDISTHNRSSQEAYEHWREASNFLYNYFLAIAFKEGYAIAQGSTMASPHAKNALNTIRNVYGYTTTILHLSCEETTRRASENKRQQGGVVQCTEIDFREKQTLFLTLLGDYIGSADQVHFYYRSSMDSIQLAAKVEQKQLEIYQEDALSAIQQLHDAAAGEGFWSNITEDLKK